MRVYFEGRLTRLWEYEVSLQRSLEGAWDLLDGNLNFHPSDAFQVKFGRMLVPYSYDWFDHLEQYFITPERALFPLNFGLSRQAGLMAWGRAGEGRLDWALGGFNGHLTGLADNNPNQEAVGYFNLRPFLGSDRSRPCATSTSAPRGPQARSRGTRPPCRCGPRCRPPRTTRPPPTPRPSSLTSTRDVFYQGDRLFGAVHLAYYHRGLSFESEWNFGRFQMTRAGLRDKPEVPVRGFHAALGYFVTGEEVERRTTVVPLRPFRPICREWGPGAIEPFVRFSQLNLGDIVFQADLADGHSWTDDVSMVDLGVNWYPNRWVKFYLDWQHAAFGSPVLVNEAKGASSAGARTCSGSAARSTSDTDQR